MRKKRAKLALFCYWGHILKIYLVPAGHPVFCKISKLTNWSKTNLHCVWIFLSCEISFSQSTFDGILKCQPWQMALVRHI